MQRFFSTFPGSWPGAGLLLLRAVAGGAAVTQAVLYVSHASEPNVAMWALGGLTAVSGAALIIGFMTPGAGALVTITTIAIAMTWTSSSSSSLVLARITTVFVTADATALALLGPGAHSMDAYLFGRREIIIPQEQRYDEIVR